MQEVVWPLAAVAVAAIFIVVFRKPISDLIGRIRSIGGPLPISTEAQERQSALPATSDTLKPSPLDDFNSPLLLQVEKTIRDDPKIQGVKSTEERELILLRHLAGTRVLLFFERTYFRIYGSQQAALRTLNSQGLVSRDFLRPFYDSAAAAFPDQYKSITFDAWLAFLTHASRMVDTTGEEVSISLIGREFLKWCVEVGHGDRWM